MEKKPEKASWGCQTMIQEGHLGEEEGKEGGGDAVLKKFPPG